MDPIDIVIPVRYGEANEELRYCLRAIAERVPHRRVWLAGYRPKWVSDAAGHVPRKQQGDKHANSLGNILAACGTADISDEFYLWNDDIFPLGPLPADVPAMHRGPVSEFLAGYGRARSTYLHGMAATAEVLKKLDVADPLCYELHVPMRMDKLGVLAAMLAAKANAPRGGSRALQVRTLYGNLYGVGGERVEDVKIFKTDQRWEPGHPPYVSTMDHVWGAHPASRLVMDSLPEPGPYERKR